MATVVVVVVALFAAACAGSSDTASATADPPAADAEPTAQPEASEPTAPPEPTDAPEPTAAAEPTSTPAPTATPEPERAAIEYLDVGPYPVGVQTVTLIDEERDRRIPLEIWFPLAPGTTGDPARYNFVTGDFYESPRALDADLDVAATDGPYPLVVYSHGSGGIRYIHSDYTETIASHGYVVVAPDHPGNTSLERVLGTTDDFLVTAVNRPNDMIFTIDAMVDPDHPVTGDFVSLVDPEHIAVTGHSFGGFTTFAIASGYENANGTTPCLLYTSPSPRDATLSRMPSSA